MSPFRHAARLVGAAAAGLLAAAAPCLPSFAASSQLDLQASSPDEGQSLSAAPTDIRLQFAQPLDGRAVTVLVACNGTPAVVTNPATADPDGRSVNAAVSGTQPGDCNVTWQVASANGAPISDSYSFTIEEPSTDAATDSTPSTTAATGGSTTTTPPSDGAASSSEDGAGASGLGGPLFLARLFSFIGILGLFGGLLLITLAWVEGVEYLVTLRYLRVVWIVGAAATVLVVIFSTARLPGNSLGGAISPASWGDLFDTNTGKALLVRLLLVLASGWVAWQPDRATDPSTQIVGLGLPGLAVVTLGLSRGGGGSAAIGAFGGVVQALGAAVWFGGLLLLVRAVLVGPGEEDLVHAVRGHARLAPIGIVAVVIGGVLQVSRLDGFAILTSGHGRLSVLSGLAIALAIYLGTATRQFAAQRLAHADHLDGRIAHRLRRAFTFEVLLGVLALLFTSWMLALTPPKLSAAAARDSTAYDFVTDRTNSPEFDVRLMLTSRVLGRAGMRLEVYRPTDGLSGVKVTFVPPDDHYTDVDQFVVQAPTLTGAGAAVLPAQQGVPLSVTGRWTVLITADGKPAARVFVDVISASDAEAAASTTPDGSTVAPDDSTAPTDGSTAAPDTSSPASGDTAAATTTATTAGP